MRLISALCALALLASIAGALAMRSAAAYAAAGREPDFPAPVFGADRLRLGVNVSLTHYDADTLDARLALLRQSGVRVVRQEFRWDTLEPVRGVFDWAHSDRIFNALRKHGLQVFAVLWTTPEWARGPSGTTLTQTIASAPPEHPADFAAFAGAFASRYDDGETVLAYQIWDEPNLSAAWGDGLINPTLYVQLLRSAGDAIRAHNPNAIIALGALAPTVEQSAVNLAPQTYLLKLYQLGAHQAFDVVTAKPYGFDFAPDDRRIDPELLNFSHVTLLRDVMVAHGEAHKAIWAGQFGWNALPAGWPGEASIWGAVSEAEQAAFTTAAIRRAAEEWPWMGAMFIEALEPAPRENDPQRDARWGFALLDQTGQPRKVFEALRTEGAAAAASAPRAALFADCARPQSVARTLRLENLITALPEVTASAPDCRAPSPQAEFSPGWRFDQLGADIPARPDAAVRVRFHGDAFALWVRRGNYRAYTYVRIDGRPANLLPSDARGAYLIMTSPGLYPVIERIPVASGLGPGEHVAEITVDRGWNQWALIGWSARAAPPSAIPWPAALLPGLLALLGVLYFTPRARWGGLLKRGLMRSVRMPDWRALLAALLLWLGSGVAWAQDAATAWRLLGLPVNLGVTGAVSAGLFWSPALVISIVALLALAVLIVLRLETGLMLAAFFIPFFLLPQRLFARAFPMIEILTLLCLLSWAVHNWRALLRPSGWLRGWRVLDIGVAAFVAVGVFSTLQAARQVEAWRELRLVIVEPALLYLMLRSTPLDAAARRAVLAAFVLGGVTVAAYGLFNYARGVRFLVEGGLPRIKSVFNSANNDALYLERVLPVAVAMAVFGAARARTRALWGLGALIVLAALMLTQSRGALLFGVPASLIVMALLAGGRWRLLGAVALIAALAGIALLASGALAPLVAGTRLANAFDLTRGTGFFRLNLWLSAWRMFLDHPLLGVGPDNFLYAYRSFYILPAAWQEPNLSHPHNVIFDWLTRLGALGALTLGVMLAGLSMRIRRLLAAGETRAFGLGAAGVLAAVLAHGAVDHAFFLVDLMFAFMVLAGLTSGEGPMQATRNDAE